MLSSSARDCFDTDWNFSCLCIKIWRWLLHILLTAQNLGKEEKGSQALEQNKDNKKRQRFENNQNTI